MRSSILLSFLLTLSAAGVMAQTVAPAGASDFRVGDALRLTVWGGEEYSGMFDIGEDGTVIHPLYRSIVVAGLSRTEAEAEFRRLLQRFLMEPQIIIEPLFRVGVGGEVRTPGIVTVSAYSTVDQAVALAGGPTPTARMNSVRLIRDGREVRLDLTNPNSPGAGQRLRSGDQVLVVGRRDVLRNVVSPALSALGSITAIVWAVTRLRSG
jgi:protein involved in polysaccharide export with SLBB domain